MVKAYTSVVGAPLAGTRMCGCFIVYFASGDDVISRSATLNGYSFLVAEVEKNINYGMTRDEAIIKAINACIEKGILLEFLTGNIMEVADMLSFEYDQEAERRAMRLDGIQEGMEIGIQEGIQKGMQEGIQKGMQEGVQKGMRNIIFKMVNKGKSFDEISELVGMSIVDIQNIIN